MGLPSWETTLRSSPWINLFLHPGLQIPATPLLVIFPPAYWFAVIRRKPFFFFNLPCLTCESLTAESCRLTKPPAQNHYPMLLLHPTAWILELASLTPPPERHLPALHATPLSSQNLAVPVIPAVRVQKRGPGPSQNQVGISPACII